VSRPSTSASHCSAIILTSGAASQQDILCITVSYRWHYHFTKLQDIYCCQPTLFYDSETHMPLNLCLVCSLFGQSTPLLTQWWLVCLFLYSSKTALSHLISLVFNNEHDFVETTICCFSAWEMYRRVEINKAAAHYYFWISFICTVNKGGKLRQAK
jgi:hypothetical protein